MVDTILLYIALAVFGLGLVYKVWGWFRFSLGISDPGITTATRVWAALVGIPAVLFSPKIFTLLRVLVVDVLFQNHIRKQEPLRWIMHLLIYAAFTFLFFLHALDKIIVTSLFEKYYLVLNPYLLVSGCLVIAGLAIAAYRRFVLNIPRLKTFNTDVYPFILITVILLSGIAMEMTKLSSYTHYQTFWDIHFGACMIGLSFLPMTKMFHLLTTPLSLLANAVMDQNSRPTNIKTRQVMELDACMHCTNCSRRCSVATAYDNLGNEIILPSERMTFLKAYVAQKDIGTRGMAALQQGIYLCTNCDRCTVICPAGINLRELWFNLREEVIRTGACVSLMLTPFSYYRGLRRMEVDAALYDNPLNNTQAAVAAPFKLVSQTDVVLTLPPVDTETKRGVGLSSHAGTFAYCFTCENCSTVCPVVGNYEAPEKELDLLPHQIIRSIGMGIRDLALGSRMLWYCLTCYQCQEHCPQGVKVADIFYELKNLAAAEAKCGPVRPAGIAHADS
jgi:heterodisulfide reductase subunit C/nitrate reductase gamma subunit